MKPRAILAATLAMILPGPRAERTPEAPGGDLSQLAGTWTGVLKAGPVSLHMVLHFTQHPDGSWIGTLDSPDQGKFGIPIDRIEYRESILVATSNRLHGGFTGCYRAQEDQFEGKWSQGLFKAALVLRRGEAPVAKRPQEPTPPFPYRVEEVSYASGIDTLFGTLTIPEGHGPFPAVLLIPGSGRHDRDSTLFGHKPFKLWADILTRRGIAVLRVDDRGIGGSTLNHPEITSESNAQDAQAGVAYLRSRSDIDARGIGLLGHSEGGLIADMVAASDSAIAFIVLLAAPGLPGDQIIVQQVGKIAQAMGQSPEKVQEGIAKQMAILEIVKGPDDVPTARRRLTALLTGFAMAEDERELVPGTIETLLSPWYRFFVRTDPRKYLTNVRCPVLAVNGQADVQVEAEPNLAAIRSTLESNGNHAVTVLSEPHLNHLMQTAKTGLPTEYGELEGTVAPAVLEAVGSWIALEVRKSREAARS